MWYPRIIKLFFPIMRNILTFNVHFSYYNCSDLQHNIHFLIISQKSLLLLGYHIYSGNFYWLYTRFTCIIILPFFLGLISNSLVWQHMRNSSWSFTLNLEVTHLNPYAGTMNVILEISGIIVSTYLYTQVIHLYSFRTE